MLGSEIARQFEQNGIRFTGTDCEVDITGPVAKKTGFCFLTFQTKTAVIRKSPAHSL